MTSYGFNQNFSTDSLGGGSAGFGYGFSHGPSVPQVTYSVGVKRDYYDAGYYNDDPFWFNYETPSSTTYPTDAIEEPTDGSDPPSNFSVRWTGYFKAPTTETYTFYLESDDSSHMWIGPTAKVGWTIDNVFIDNGGVHGPYEVSNTISLVSGNYYPIQVFFGEETGGSVCTFSYSTDTIPKTTDLTGLVYYSPNLDPFLRGIENTTPVTVVTSGSVTINGQTFSWPTFDAAGPDPAGWNTLFAAPPNFKFYSISGAGSLGGPPAIILDLVDREDLPAGLPLICSGSVSTTGSVGVGDYGINVECTLSSIGPPVYNFTSYLGATNLPNGLGSFEWSDTYGSSPPNPGLVLVNVGTVDNITGDRPILMSVFVSPPVPSLVWTSSNGTATIQDWESQIQLSTGFQSALPSGSQGYVLVLGTAASDPAIGFSLGELATPGATLQFTGFSLTTWNSVNNWRVTPGIFGGGFKRMDLLETPSSLFVPGNVSNIDDFAGVITTGTLATVPAPNVILLEMRESTSDPPWPPGDAGLATVPKTYVALLNYSTADSLGWLPV